MSADSQRKAGGAGKAESSIPPDIARRAVEWLVDLQDGSATAATRDALDAWRSAHPDHERAWQRIETVNGRFAQLVSPFGSALVRAVVSPRHAAGRRKTLKAVAAILFGAGMTWTAREQLPLQTWLADERTGTGERRVLTLTDGSEVALNSASAISIHFDQQERRLRLVEGEILITTGKDSKAPDGRPRPFVVETAQGSLRPLGTRFSVRQFAQATRLGVFEGAVAIYPRESATTSRIVHAGEQVQFTATEIGGIKPADTASTAWKDNMLVVSGMRLDDFLAELSRHRPGRVSCDPAIAGLRISGTYPLEDTDRIIAALRTILPVEVHALTRYWITVRARA